MAKTAPTFGGVVQGSTPKAGAAVVADGDLDGASLAGTGGQQHAMAKGGIFSVAADTMGSYQFVTEGWTPFTKPVVRKLYG